MPDSQKFISVSKRIQSKVYVYQYGGPYESNNISLQILSTAHAICEQKLSSHKSLTFTHEFTVSMQALTIVKGCYHKTLLRSLTPA